MTDPTGKPRRNLTSALTDLYQSRGLLLGLLATTIGLVLIVLTPPTVTQISQDAAGRFVVSTAANLFTRLHIDDIGVAVFQAGLTITLFQVLLNRIAEDRFAERVELSLTDHE
jgi:hypothetical protein